MTRVREWLLGFARLGRLVVRAFLADRCLLLASSLAYTTVLSLVPFLAVAFSVSTGLGLQNTSFIRNVLLHLTAGRAQVVEAVIAYINNTNVRTLGAVGTATLIFTAVFLVQTIEDTLNIIWAAVPEKGAWRKAVDYAAFILLGPLFVLTGLSATAAVESSALFQWLVGFQVIGYLYGLFLRLLPFLVSWTALFLVYRFMPGTRVRLAPALAGAVTAGTLWQATGIVYVRYQIGAAGYNAIYGSFAQIPLLLLWLYVSWAIVLLGAEISHAVQTASTYTQEVAAAGYSPRDRYRLALLVFLLLAKNFETGEIPTSNEDMAKLFGAPLRLVNSLLRLFAGKRLVAGVEGLGEREAYILSRPSEKIRLRDIRSVVLDERGEDVRPLFDRDYAVIDEMEAWAEDGTGGEGPTLRQALERFGGRFDGIVQKKAGQLD